MSVTTQSSTDWHAVAYILDHPSLRGRVNSFLDVERESIDLAIRDQPWSSGQQLLVDIALSLYSGDVELPLRSALVSLDDSAFCRIMRAVDLLRGGGVTIDEEFDISHFDFE